MTKIKLCGLSRTCDIEVANELNPEYIGFVFAPKSKRYVSPEKAVRLKELLCSDIKAVGVFVNESLKTVEALLKSGVIDMAQLHGNEGEEYIRKFEVKAAVRAGARIIGVNNRNLKDFSVDTGNSARLRRLIPKEVLFVSESGVSSSADIAKLCEIGTDAVLIGETLMVAANKKARLAELRGTL